MADTVRHAHVGRRRRGERGQGGRRHRSPESERGHRPLPRPRCERRRHARLRRLELEYDGAPGRLLEHLFLGQQLVEHRILVDGLLGDRFLEHGLLGHSLLGNRLLEHLLVGHGFLGLLVGRRQRLGRLARRRLLLARPGPGGRGRGRARAERELGRLRDHGDLRHGSDDLASVAMSTIETAAALPAGASARGPGLPRHARRFYACVMGVALAVAGVAVAAPAHVTNDRWTEFAFLLAGAAGAHYFVVHTSKNQVFHVGLAFAVAGALVLPPRLVVLMCVVQHLSDWAKERYAWYIQVFNIGNYVLAAMAAHEVTRLAGTGVTTRQWGALVAGVGACVAFVAVNHVLLARMLWLARGRSLDESGLFAFESLLSDLVLALFGLTLVILWHVDPWALPIVFPPLFLIQRALTVPQLWAEARTDAKTELYNARHFSLELAAELRRASRFRRPVSLLMADLDLLREVNNSHGHLAGDAVLRGVADVLRRVLRDYDTAARFGGEEFTVLLPETDGERARVIAERIPAGVEAHQFSLAPRPGTVNVTISVGVATFPDDGSTPEALLDAADTALYRAKLAGRNSV